MEALCWLLYGVDEEGVWNVLPTLEGAVYPEGSAAPYLCGAGAEGRVRDSIGTFQSSAVVGNAIRTLLVVIPVTTC